MPQSWRAYGLKADSGLLPLISSRIPTFYQARVKCRSAIMPGASTPASSPLQLDRVRFHDESLERKQNFMEHGCTNITSLLMETFRMLQNNRNFGGMYRKELVDLIAAPTSWLLRYAYLSYAL